MKVLVTGASGMLGGAVADALAARGDDVTVLQRRPSGLRHREVLADVVDAAAVRSAVAGHDAVVHLAAKVDIQGRYREFARVNITGTRNVVSACRRAGVARLVHVSTPAVAHHGTALVGAPAGPADPRSARGHYARSNHHWRCYRHTWGYHNAWCYGAAVVYAAVVPVASAAAIWAAVKAKPTSTGDRDG